jgi:hypothetical protein
MQLSHAAQACLQQERTVRSCHASAAADVHVIAVRHLQADHLVYKQCLQAGLMSVITRLYAVGRDTRETMPARHLAGANCGTMPTRQAGAVCPLQLLLLLPVQQS